MKCSKHIDNRLFSFIEKEKTYQLHIDQLNKIKHDVKRKDNINQHMRYLEQMQNNKLQSSFRVYQNKMYDIEKNNKKLLDRILSITKRNNENSRNSSGILQSLGSLSCDRPQSKSLSVDYKRKENKKIMKENLFLVKQIINRKPFLSVEKIQKDFKDHSTLINRMRKMDKENKILIKGLDKIPNSIRQKLPHINDVGMSKSKSTMRVKGRVVSSSLEKRDENKREAFWKGSYLLKKILK